MDARVLATNISVRKGTQKQGVPSITIDQRGVVGDAHAGRGLRQVSLLSRELIEEFSRKSGKTYGWGDFAENITTEGLELREVAVPDRLRIGETEMEVTQLGKECHGSGCAIFQEVGACIMPKEGVFCRVVHGGVVKRGDIITHVPTPLRMRVITLSDRASRGEYQDLSGPALRQTLEEFFRGRRHRVQVSQTLIPDDAGRLKAEVLEACSAGAAAIFTTGGTGIGPRDITPDVLQPLLDKQLPGLMDYVRLKHAARNPAVLLSRSLAGVRGQTLVFALPGSPKAVAEYMEVIEAVLVHALSMIQGVDAH
jgi:molybdopterin adenylyltransferase